MFDPEKVRNYTLSGIQHEPVNQHYVKASDYDRLLVLYRAHDLEMVRLGIERGVGCYAAQLRAERDTFLAKELAVLLEKVKGRKVMPITLELIV